MGATCSDIGQTNEYEIIYEGDPAKNIICKKKVKYILYRILTTRLRIINIMRNQLVMKLSRSQLKERGLVLE